MIVHELDVLTDSERDELANRHRKWQALRENRQWVEVDALRAELMAMGADLEYADWHPARESTACRYARFKAREALTLLNQGATPC